MKDNNKENKNLLSSWKEIAVFLDCDVRTCQRWEKTLGLPVRRFDESSRSSVFAYKEELDGWLKTKLNHVSSDQKALAKKKLWQKRFFLVVPSALIILSLFFLMLFRDAQPADFKIVNSKLVILNEKGRELWTFDTELENLSGEDHYRQHFQTKKVLINDEKMREITWPRLRMSDIDNDNKIETLFVPHTPDNYGEGLFYCFNHRGKIKWTFLLGEKIKYGKEIFADFTNIGFDSEDFNNDGYMEIILLSHAVQRFPTQLCILDHNGQKMGEYWNSGMLQDFVFFDLNGDGEKELIVSGMNNEYRKGCLVVFDPSNINGGSYQEEEYTKSEKLEKGTEKYYILFPQTDIAITNSWYGNIRIMNFLNNGVLELEEYGTVLFYHLNYNLEVINILDGHRFQELHAEAKRAGIISSVLNSDYIKNLLENVLYWNGSTWVHEPAMSNPWKNSKN
ncbi:MAG: VCBS repeat-containing protein [Candidatus Aminicenantes bacterium]|nr:VCBS repeat-containing protein [Candidatus Aminicenantes bacterium]